MNSFQKLDAFLGKLDDAIEGWWDKKIGVPQTYRMNQQFYNELRGKPTIIDANGNIYVKIGDQKYYV